MPNESISVNSTFGLLNDGQSRWGSFCDQHGRKRDSFDSAADHWRD